MPVPKFSEFLRPVLDIVNETPGVHNSEAAESAAALFKLNDQEKLEAVKTGRPKYVDRVLWALTYLRQAKLISTVRGKSTITDRGKDFLKIAPSQINPSDLRQFPEFAEFSSGTQTKSIISSDPTIDGREEQLTPFEQMRLASQEIRKSLNEQVLETLRTVTPSRFEQIIVDLMLRLGYGGDFADAGRAVGQTGDGGIDGIIQQDRLGLDNVYLQAKRYTDAAVSIGEVNSFIGALTTRGATKGVFMTTSRFTEKARAAVENARHLQLSLIDGKELSSLMIDANLGVTIESVFEVKRLDSGYFEFE